MSNRNKFYLVGLLFVAALLVVGVVIGRSGEKMNKSAVDETAEIDGSLAGSELAMIEEDKAFNIDADESSVVWFGRKRVGAAHTGTINVVSGKFFIKRGRLAGGEVVVDMTSIASSDLEGISKNTLEKHLRSSDFFSVDQYPEARLVVKELTAEGRVVADLTIKDRTKEVAFPVAVTELGSGYVITANLLFDRADFDVRYGSDRFFDNLGDDLIENEVRVEVKMVAREEQ